MVLMRECSCYSGNKGIDAEQSSAAYQQEESRELGNHDDLSYFCSAMGEREWEEVLSSFVLCPEISEKAFERDDDVSRKKRTEVAKGANCTELHRIVCKFRKQSRQSREPNLNQTKSNGSN